MFIFFKRKSEEIKLQVIATNLVARYAKCTFLSECFNLGYKYCKMKDLGSQSITTLILKFVMNSMTFRI